MSYWCVFFSLSSNSRVSAGQSWQGNDAGSHMEAAVSLGETAGTQHFGDLARHFFIHIRRQQHTMFSGDCNGCTHQ